LGATIFSSEEYIESLRNTRPRLSSRMPLSPINARGENVLCGSIKPLLTNISKYYKYKLVLRYSDVKGIQAGLPGWMDERWEEEGEENDMDADAERMR